MTHTQYGYQMAVRHLKERAEMGQTLEEIIKGLEFTAGI